MTRLKTTLVVIFMLLVATPSLRAQLSNIAVVDFERAIVESAEGKKSSDKFNATVQAKQADLEKKQREIEDLQKKLQAGTRTLSDSAKADIQRDIDRRNTELQRVNEDAQKEMQALRDELLRPIAQVATQILNGMAAEQGYTLVIDSSNPENNLVFVNPKNDITAELVKRINAATPKEPPKPATAAPATPKPAPAPATPPKP
jgi:outer membrane protein